MVDSLHICSGGADIVVLEESCASVGGNGVASAVKVDCTTLRACRVTSESVVGDGVGVLCHNRTTISACRVALEGVASDGVGGVSQINRAAIIAGSVAGEGVACYGVGSAIQINRAALRICRVAGEGVACYGVGGALVINSSTIICCIVFKSIVGNFVTSLNNINRAALRICRVASKRVGCYGMRSTISVNCTTGICGV